MERNTSQSYFQNLLDVLGEFNDIYLIFTMPNSDTDGRIIKEMINNFVDQHTKRSIAFDSMGSLNYLSTMQFVDGVIGNSSSGLLEAPSFKIGTINIGRRQEGRLKAESIIDCSNDVKSIANSIKLLYSADFQKKLKKVVNPYGDGNASEKIINFLKNVELPKSLIKNYHDQ